MINHCLHEAFLDSDSMGLADEGVAHQAFETINERHVLGKSSDEGGKLKSFLVPEVSGQYEEVGPQFEERGFGLLPDMFDVFVVKFVCECARYEVGVEFEDELEDSVVADSIRFQGLDIVG